MNISSEATPRAHVAPISLPQVPPRLQTVTADTLLNMAIPLLRWSVPNLLPEGIALLAGKPKMGKSWFALALAASVASGVSYIDGLEVEQGDVLYLALEDSELRLQQRLKHVLLGAEPPSLLDLAVQCPRLDLGGYEQIAAWIDTHPETRLVILDTLARVRPPTRSNTNLYQEDYNVLGQLKALATERRVTLLVVHHLRKGGASDPLDEVSGSTGLTGAVDAVLVLKRVRGSQDAILYATGRDIEEQEIALNFSPGSGRWALKHAGGSKPKFAQARQHTLRDAILDQLRAATAPLSPVDIIRGVHGNPDSVRTTLALMHRDGALHRPARGLYTLAAA